jgi:hypothetical protein
MNHNKWLEILQKIYYRSLVWSTRKYTPIKPAESSKQITYGHCPANAMYTQREKLKLYIRVQGPDVQYYIDFLTSKSYSIIYINLYLIWFDVDETKYIM